MLKAISYGLLIAGMFVGLAAFKQGTALQESIARGKDAYALYCQNCHMEDGKGQEAAFPSLVKNDFLKKPAKALIENVLKVQSGEIKINGITYNGIMPAQNYLTDEQIADILNYVRNSWGNTAALAIKPAQVKQARQ